METKAFFEGFREWCNAHQLKQSKFSNLVVYRSFKSGECGLLVKMIKARSVESEAVTNLVKYLLDLKV